MGALIGEYECKLDEKGRLMVPSGLKKQLPANEQKKFVVNRGFEKQLNMYPQKEWEKISSQINELNLFVKQNREFVRKFNNGATEVEVDGSGRILLPKTLMQYAGIDKEAILFAHSNRIEIWSKAEYDKFMKEGADDFAALAEQVMGNIPNKGKADVS